MYIISKKESLVDLNVQGYPYSKILFNHTLALNSLSAYRNEMEYCNNIVSTLLIKISLKPTSFDIEKMDITYNYCLKLKKLLPLKRLSPQNRNLEIIGYLDRIEVTPLGYTSQNQRFMFNSELSSCSVGGDKS